MKEGYEVWHEPALAQAAADHPWEVGSEVARRLGARLVELERQPIRAVEGGRSFASRDGPAPLHTDSQLVRRCPPHLQVLCCVRPAERGGESLLADTHALERVVAHRLPALHRALYQSVRSFPFVFGDFEATTIASVGESTFFTHSPRADDALGQALRGCLERLVLVRRALRAGDVFVVDNHRMLHGRAPFVDRRRELQRLLLWLDAPLAPEPRAERASREGSAPRRTGLDGSHLSIPAETRRALVAEVRRGTPPGVVAARRGVPEPWLYAYRDEVDGLDPSE